MQAHRIGIIGAGQLGRMMALAAYPLGLTIEFLDRDADSPGGRLAPIVVADLDDRNALETLAARVDVLTFDIENVSTAALDALAAAVAVRPGADAVAVAQDRLAEKQLFARHGIPTAAYVAVDGPGDFDTAANRLGWPIMLKARRMGYDGRGQRVADDAASLAAAWDELGRVPALAEQRVAFERELSIIAVQGGAGEQVFYPLSENRHENGILVETVAPYADTALQRQAEAWAAAILTEFDYRGVLTIEFFVEDGRLIANEMAPRVHNSGHWTIEGAETSQFENHVRAVAGLPLGSTAARGHCAMLNLLGRMPDRARVLAERGAHLHDYGKTPRPARKLGHITLVDGDRDSLLVRLAALRDAIGAADS